MSYSIVIDEEPARKLRDLPVDVICTIQNELERLRADPTRLSTTTYFPYRQDGQLFQFSATDAEGGRWWITVIFQYAADEQTINVIGLSAQNWRPGK